MIVTSPPPPYTCLRFKCLMTTSSLFPPLIFSMEAEKLMWPPVQGGTAPGGLFCTITRRRKQRKMEEWKPLCRLCTKKRSVKSLTGDGRVRKNIQSHLRLFSSLSEAVRSVHEHCQQRGFVPLKSKGNSLQCTNLRLFKYRGIIFWDWEKGYFLFFKVTIIHLFL
jgi:hypothetical protein